MSDKDSGLPGDAKAGEGDKQNSPVNTESETVSAADFLALQNQVKAIQSGKDRAVAQTNKELNAIKKQQEQFTEMQAYLVKYETPEEAARQFSLDQLLKAGDEGITQPVVDGTDLAGQEQPAVEVDLETLKVLGVDANSAEYLEQIKAGKPSKDAALAVYAARQSGETPPVEGTASGVSGGSSGTQTQTATSVLQAQFDKEVVDVPRGNPYALETLKVKYRKQGLEIW